MPYELVQQPQKVTIFLLLRIGIILSCMVQSLVLPKIEGQALLGKHKWLGGALTKDNIFFASPSHANYVLRVDPKANNVSLVGTSYEGKYKWLRAVYNEATDSVWSIPCFKDSPLRINVQNGNTKVISSYKKLESSYQNSWQWHGGAIGDDGKIYAPPANARGVLCIDPATSTVEELPIFNASNAGQKNQFYGAIAALDRRTIWGVPFASESILKIQCSSASFLPKCTTLQIPSDGTRNFLGYEHNWHGGLVCHRTGAVFCFPANADTVLRIGTNDEISLLKVPGPRGRYQWAGGVQCPASGIIYGTYAFP
uniref:Uncharacterized protein n=1 Tax=Aureoumbra lagunensis TaxID=44058 RepID=A0A7S3JUP2_9STRA|mmetsp:Transcript_12277/g.16566  ORF Transcript_12277/g.16566 Transcript_12277/m.16566 type:complete len:311 (-) Transcript_12277:539-1471(-)